MRILPICRGAKTFLNPLLAYWESQEYIMASGMADADVVFVEWANEQSTVVTQQVRHRNVVVRMHGSEYFQNFHTAWNKEKVAALICANPTYKVPRVPTVSIPTPIDTDFWAAPTGTLNDSHSLIMAGSFVYSKNHVGLLSLLSDRPNYFNKILFVGDMQAQDNPYRYAETQKVLAQIRYYAEKHKLPVTLIDAVSPEKLRELYRQCGYIVSNSINEGCHLVIGEGILCGCRPLIYDWMGAREIYGFETYYNAKTFWDMVDNYPYATATYLRETILTKFNQNKIFSTIDDVIFEAAREWL